MVGGKARGLQITNCQFFAEGSRTNYYRVRDTNLAHLPDTALLPPLQRRNPLEDRRL
jgi:hypothetical protein